LRVDEYQPASFRSLLLLLAAVIVGVVLIWLIVSAGLGSGDVLSSPGLQDIDPGNIPGVVPGN